MIKISIFEVRCKQCIWVKLVMYALKRGLLQNNYAIAVIFQRCMFAICKLQYNSFSIPLATDGLGAKSPTIPPVFDTQITSITETKTSPSIFVFTFDALPFFSAFSRMQL